MVAGKNRSALLLEAFASRGEKKALEKFFQEDAFGTEGSELVQQNATVQIPSFTSQKCSNESSL